MSNIRRLCNLEETKPVHPKPTPYTVWKNSVLRQEDFIVWTTPAEDMR